MESASASAAGDEDIAEGAAGAGAEVESSMVPEETLAAGGGSSPVGAGETTTSMSDAILTLSRLKSRAEL